MLATIYIYASIYAAYMCSIHFALWLKLVQTYFLFVQNLDLNMQKHYRLAQHMKRDREGKLCFGTEYSLSTRASTTSDIALCWNSDLVPRLVLNMSKSRM